MLKGSHIGSFLVLTDPSVASPNYSKTEDKIKSVPTAETGDDAKITDKLANLLSKIGIGKNTWKDLKELSCPSDWVSPI